MDQFLGEHRVDIMPTERDAPRVRSALLARELFGTGRTVRLIKAMGALLRYYADWNACLI
jgi:hypothetical protein